MPTTTPQIFFWVVGSLAAILLIANQILLFMQRTKGKQPSDFCKATIKASNKRHDGHEAGIAALQTSLDTGFKDLGKTLDKRIDDKLEPLKERVDDNKTDLGRLEDVQRSDANTIFKRIEEHRLASDAKLDGMVASNTNLSAKVGKLIGYVESQKEKS